MWRILPLFARSRNPGGVGFRWLVVPRVARSSQPWALRRNPFGILLSTGCSWRLIGRHSHYCNHCDAMSMLPRCRGIVPSTQQLLDFIPAQRGGKFFFAANGGLDDLAFSVL